MDQNFTIQQQIRESSNETRNSLIDLQNWEQDIKQKEKLVKGADHNIKLETAIPIRRRAIQKNQAENSLVNSEQEVKQNEATNDSTIKQLSDSEKEKGNKCVKEQDYEKGIFFYTKAIEIYSIDSVYFSNRAFCFLKLKRFEECISDCNKALEHDPRNVKAIYRRMQAYESLQKYKCALEDCRRLVEYEPTITSHKNVYLKLKKSAEIEEENNSTNSLNNKNQHSLEFIIKPPHLRSKKPLKLISITEIEDKTANLRSKNIENSLKEVSALSVDNEDRIPDDVVDKIFNNATGESSPFPPSFSNIYSPRETKHFTQTKTETKKITIKPMATKSSDSSSQNESTKVEKSALEISSEKENDRRDLEAERDKFVLPDMPKSGSEFQKTWRVLTSGRKFLYLKQIISMDLANILESSLDSELLSDLLQILKLYFIENDTPVDNILRQIAHCKEINVLSLFLSESDKNTIKELLSYMNSSSSQVSSEDVGYIRQRFGCD